MWSGWHYEFSLAVWKKQIKIQHLSVESYKSLLNYENFFRPFSLYLATIFFRR